MERTTALKRLGEFRNHPFIAVWCARNEGYPPPEIDEALRKLMAELEPTRRYQPSSTDGAAVRSHGPYHWRTPREYYDFFKTETGSVSVPTLESIHGMMPKKDWQAITDDWAEHDLAKEPPAATGTQRFSRRAIAKSSTSLTLSARRSWQIMKPIAPCMQARNARLFHPATAVITRMRNPAQPSFVWRLYRYDLEPNASLFAVRHAGELVHIQFNEANDELQAINRPGRHAVVGRTPAVSGPHLFHEEAGLSRCTTMRLRGASWQENIALSGDGGESAAGTTVELRSFMERTSPCRQAGTRPSLLKYVIQVDL